MSRSLPDDAYLEKPCPRCGGPMADLMGDDVCLECGAINPDEGVSGQPETEDEHGTA